MARALHQLADLPELADGAIAKLLFVEHKKVVYRKPRWQRVRLITANESKRRKATVIRSPFCKLMRLPAGCAKSKWTHGKTRTQASVSSFWPFS